MHKDSRSHMAALGVRSALGRKRNDWPHVRVSALYWTEVTLKSMIRYS